MIPTPEFPTPFPHLFPPPQFLSLQSPRCSETALFPRVAYTCPSSFFFCMRHGGLNGWWLQGQSIALERQLSFFLTPRLKQPPSFLSPLSDSVVRFLTPAITPSDSRPWWLFLGAAERCFTTLKERPANAAVWLFSNHFLSFPTSQVLLSVCCRCFFFRSCFRRMGAISSPHGCSRFPLAITPLPTSRFRFLRCVEGGDSNPSGSIFSGRVPQLRQQVH